MRVRCARLICRTVAGTSTGGLSNKMVGRVGDSPLIGAGTYANDQLAVSCTGRGEQFIRHQVAYQLAARVRFANESLEHAAQCILEQELIAGDGGKYLGSGVLQLIDSDRINCRG